MQTNKLELDNNIKQNKNGKVKKDLEFNMCANGIFLRSNEYVDR